MCRIISIRHTKLKLTNKALTQCLYSLSRQEPMEKSTWLEAATREMMHHNFMWPSWASPPPPSPLPQQKKNLLHLFFNSWNSHFCWHLSPSYSFFPHFMMPLVNHVAYFSFIYYWRGFPLLWVHRPRPTFWLSVELIPFPKVNNSQKWCFMVTAGQIINLFYMAHFLWWYRAWNVKPKVKLLCHNYFHCSKCTLKSISHAKI